MATKRIAKLVLPVYKNDQRQISPKIVDDVLGKVVTLWDGFTGTNAQGGWFNQGLNRLQVEPVVVIEIAMEDREEERAKLRAIAAEFGRDADQVIVMVVHANGEVEMVPPAARQIAQDNVIQLPGNNAAGVVLLNREQGTPSEEEGV